jgi:hypothetical protein
VGNIGVPKGERRRISEVNIDADLVRNGDALSLTMTATRRPSRLVKDVIEERRLTGTEKAGKNGYGQPAVRSFNHSFQAAGWKTRSAQ